MINIYVYSGILKLVVKYHVTLINTHLVPLATLTSSSFPPNGTKWEEGASPVCPSYVACHQPSRGFLVIVKTAFLGNEISSSSSAVYPTVAI